MGRPILVTGALGNVGTEVVKALQALGWPVRAADLDVDKLRTRFGEGIEAVAFDYARPETFEPALRDAQGMFLMRPPHITDVQRYLFPVVDAARTAGLCQVAFLSLIGIENNRRVPHYAVEQYLRASDLEWTFLRASFFMQNLNTTHRAEIRDRNELFVPAGRGRTSFIDVRDIGVVAARVLTGSGHAGRAYDLTGSEALDYYQAAEIFSQVLGRPIIYRNPSVLAFVIRTWRRGTPLPFTLVMAMLYRLTRLGMADQVTPEVERLLGRPPITFRQYVADYRDNWMR